MITHQQFHQIRHLRDNEGLSAGQISRELGLSRKTVRKWMSAESRGGRSTPRRASLLDPFKNDIKALLARHDHTAVQIFRKLQTRGYKGGYSLVRDHVRLLRPPAKEAYLTLKFDPGECAQVDFGECGRIRLGNTIRKFHVFVMTLCWSRFTYVEIAMGQAAEHFLQGHRNAFEYFNAVPRKMMVDNCKTAILEHPPVGTPVPNPRYADLARFHGFEIKACRPRRGNEKGRVENGVKYFKNNFLRGYEPVSLASLKADVREWLENTANVRVHATTRQRPIDMFEKERKSLLPPPATPYDCSTPKPVNSDNKFRVSFDGNRYSVPFRHASARGLTLRALPDRLTIWRGTEMLAEHQRTYERGLDIEKPEHAAGLLERKRAAGKSKAMSSFLAISPAAEAFHQGLVEKRRPVWRNVRNVLELMSLHGRDKVVVALEEANHFRAFSSDFIANHLQRRGATEWTAAETHLTRKTDLLEMEIERPEFDRFEDIVQ